MKIFQNINISYYSRVTDTAGSVISLDRFLFNDDYVQQIEELRAATDEQTKKRIKLQLPAATISGTFSGGRRAENLVAHSGLLCVDIDRKDNLNVEGFDDLKNEWHRFPHILYAAHSVGGEGWFAIFRIARPECHRAHFEALSLDFADMGITVDQTCKDVSRLRFISYDPEPYVNENATLYDKLWQGNSAPYSQQTCTHGTFAQQAHSQQTCSQQAYIMQTHTKYVPDYYCCEDDTIEKVEKCCRLICQRGIDITSTYFDWYKVGASLVSLGKYGRSIFHQISSLYPKYNAEETDRNFSKWSKYVKNIGIGTFFYICKNNGIDWKDAG